MIVSCVIVGNVGTIEAKADATITFDKETTIYYSMASNEASWWNNNDASHYVWVVDSNSNGSWVAATKISDKLY